MSRDNNVRQTAGKKATRDTGFFLRNWLKKPLQIGAVAPSGVALSRTMASFVDPQAGGAVVEIGSGTGPVTQALIDRGVAQERLVLVEYNPDFCELLRQRFPMARVVQGDAYTLAATVAGVLTEAASAVVSCLPLLTRPEDQRVDLLRQAFDLMQPDAPFVQFTYSLKSPIPLRDAFFTWKATPLILRNIPPARVWTYRRSDGH